MNKTLLAFSIVSLSLAATFAHAQSQVQQPAASQTVVSAAQPQPSAQAQVVPAHSVTPQVTIFDKLDLNKDGEVTREEIETINKQNTENFFKTFDANQDGKISRAEFFSGSKPVEAQPQKAPMLNK